MTRIIAIGSGENGRLLPNKERAPYETKEIDEEIVRVTGKEKPNFLFVGHGVPVNIQKLYFKTMKENFSKLNCDCNMLKSNELRDEEKVDKLIDWADIIYVGGGDTLTTINLWKNTGFDKKLKEAWQNNKLLCGISAGGACWFKECISDSLKMLYGDDQPLVPVRCLGFYNFVFAPHGDDQDRYDALKKNLNDKIGLLVTKGSAIEIIDDNYKIINCYPTSYSLKTYWDNNKYIEEKLTSGKITDLLN
jgi:dipeptidase E